MWAVAKGSLVNKAILVPAALAISALAPWAVTPLLMVGVTDGRFFSRAGVQTYGFLPMRLPEGFASATLPLTGELTIPFTDAASFEFEARPKGVFVEVFRRSGLTSVGGHAFVGDRDRRVITGVVTHDLGGRLALLAGVGSFHSLGVTDTRLSLGGEATLTSRLVTGIRLDHRSGAECETR